MSIPDERMHSVRPLMVWLLVFCLAVAAWAPFTAVAQTGSEPSAESASVDTDRVEELIKTLESETARDELISDLKLLLEADEPESDEAATEMADALKIDELTQAWRQKYTQFLENKGLNASLVGYTIVTAALFLVTLLFLYLVKKLTGLMHRYLRPIAVRFNLNQQRLNAYVSIFRLYGYLIVLLLAVAAFVTLWGVDLEEWVSRDVWLFILQALFSVITVFAIAVFIVEFSNAVVEYFFKRKLAHQPARLDTLLPIARNVLFATLFTLFGLTLLSQLGVNVVPLLAGAGVVGVAIGFGAQALIKDVINGFIVIVEDLIQVGDVASVGGKTGLVERITVRKVQLRDLSGTVFTVPFSEISVVENLTKHFSYYLMNVGIAYRENTDEVVALLRQVDSEMREEEQFKDKILEPIEILGVDSFQNSAVVIKARIKTVPLQQWSVGREFNRRMKFLFDEQGVEIPFPHQTIYFGQDKDGQAPPMHVDLVAKSEGKFSDEPSKLLEQEHEGEKKKG